jgi:4'-phosphopantetheinyl transferase
VTRRPAPDPGEVHVWRASLDLPGGLFDTLACPLSQDERDRARHVRPITQRARFISSRGWLRHLLAAYLEADPAEIAFQKDAGGKPRLMTPGSAWLRFNLSRSAAVLVIAVANAREVGVDVEQVHRDFPVEAVARRFFTEREQEALFLASSADACADAFFATWTRKEAYLKGIGIGFGESEVGLEARLRGGAHRDKGVGGEELPEATGWSLAAFDAGAGYAAAVAVEGYQVRLPSMAQELSLSLV